MLFCFSKINRKELFGDVINSFFLDQNMNINDTARLYTRKFQIQMRKEITKYKDDTDGFVDNF